MQNINMNLKDLVNYTFSVIESTGSNDGASTIVDEPISCCEASCCEPTEASARCLSNGSLSLSGSFVTTEPFNPWAQYYPTQSTTSITPIDNTSREIAELRKVVEKLNLQIEIAKLRKELAALEADGKCVWVVPPYTSPADGSWIYCNNDAINRSVVFTADSIDCSVRKE